MKYVFFGTPELGRIVFERLLDRHLVPLALVTNPDKPLGRKQVLTYPPTKQLVFERKLDNQIKIFQPQKIDEGFLEALRGVNADIFIIAAYAKIVPKTLLDIPPKGVIGVHPSLLPRYRGPSPIQSVILNGEEETGVSLFLVGEGMDDGPVIASRTLSLEATDTTATLTHRLAEAGGDLLCEILPRFLSGELKAVSQNSAEATFTKKFKTEDAFIDFSDLQRAQAGDRKLAQILNQKMRAFYPEPGAYTLQDGRRLKLLESSINGDKLCLAKIQYEGEKPKQVSSI